MEFDSKDGAIYLICGTDSPIAGALSQFIPVVPCDKEGNNHYKFFAVIATSYIVITMPKVWYHFCL